MELNELADEIHLAGKSRGFHQEALTNEILPMKILSMIALIHSELSEALEAVRKNEYANLSKTEKQTQFYVNGKLDNELFSQHIKDTFEDELADSIIRILDLCGFLGIDIESHILMKMEFNSSRPYKHGVIL